MSVLSKWMECKTGGPVAFGDDHLQKEPFHGREKLYGEIAGHEEEQRGTTRSNREV